MLLNAERVLTTKELAELFGTTQGKLHIYFMRNKEKFQEGVHYYVLAGSEMMKFKHHNPTLNLKYMSNLYLWTAYGAYLFAQTLKGEDAWKGYCQCIYYFYGLEKEVVMSLHVLSEKVDQMKQ